MNATAKKWLGRVGGFFLILVDILGVLALAAVVDTEYLDQLGAAPEGVRLEIMKKSTNFDGKQFKNQIETELGPSGSYWKMTKQWLFGKQIRRPQHPIPIVTLEKSAFETPAPQGLRITWMGHSSVLIEIDGRRVLTDPIWGKRISPFKHMGPKRFHPPPIPLENLPGLDAVIISHDHYDHLEKSAVLALAPSGVRFYMPLGVGAHLEKWGVDPVQIVELDWWDSAETVAGDIQLVATPARHFSGRGLSINKTQWASFVIKGPKNRIFFSGDSGPFPGFEEIGDKYGPFQITLIKIGAYDESWPYVHLNPEQALAAHATLKGELLMPIHWGTFNLAFHNWFDPPQRLLTAAAELSTRVAIPRPGQMFTVQDPPPIERWWEQQEGP
jgi:L-ascorbate metabolism protein UlaG (beta-lactamase superfamily)